MSGGRSGAAISVRVRRCRGGGGSSGPRRLRHGGPERRGLRRPGNPWSSVGGSPRAPAWTSRRGARRQDMRVRANSARTALASTRRADWSPPRAVIPMGSSVLLLGPRRRFGDGSPAGGAEYLDDDRIGHPERVAALRPAHRISDRSGVGRGGGRGDRACLLAGRIGDRLALWRWDAGRRAPSRPRMGRSATRERIVGAGLVDDRPWLAIASGLGTRAPGRRRAPRRRVWGRRAGRVLRRRRQCPGLPDQPRRRHRRHWGRPRPLARRPLAPQRDPRSGALCTAPIRSAPLSWRGRSSPAAVPPPPRAWPGGRFWVATDAPALWATPRLGLPAGGEVRAGALSARFVTPLPRG